MPATDGHGPAQRVTAILHAAMQPLKDSCTKLLKPFDAFRTASADRNVDRIANMVEPGLAMLSLSLSGLVGWVGIERVTVCASVEPRCRQAPQTGSERVFAATTFELSTPNYLSAPVRPLITKYRRRSQT